MAFSSFNITGLAILEEQFVSLTNYIALGCFILGFALVLLYLAKETRRRRIKARKKNNS